MDRASAFRNVDAVRAATLDVAAPENDVHRARIHFDGGLTVDEGHGDLGGGDDTGRVGGGHAGHSGPDEDPVPVGGLRPDVDNVDGH